MSAIPRLNPWRHAAQRLCAAPHVVALALALAMPCAAQALYNSVGSETIHTELLPGGLDGKYDGEGFVFGVGVKGIYDSNLFITETNEQSDFSFAASPWISYNSAPPGGARFILNARYAPFFRVYLDNSNLNTVDHSGSVSLSYEGAKTTLQASADYSRFSAVDRLAGAFVEASNFGFSLNGTYQLSQKTSLDASWSAAMTDYQSARFSSSDTYALQVTGFWQATPLLRLGPSVRHSQIESANTGRRDALAFLLSLGYELTGKFSLNASAGIEFEDYERATGGDTEVQPTGNLSVIYALDALWSFQAAVRYRTLSSPSVNNYSIDNLGFSASVNRALRNGSLRAGAITNFSHYQAVGPVAAPRTDEENFSLFLGHRMNLFEDQVNLDSSIRFSKNTGQQVWSRLQLSTGFNYIF